MGGLETERRMKAAVLTAPGRVELQEVPLPTPERGQVRIRVEGCGLCGSNLPVWQGRSWFRYPLPPGSPGHEGWGVVESLGEGVRSVRPGMRVAFFSDRAFAEYDVADETALVRLPEALAETRFPGEPFGCAVNVFRRSEITAGQTVAVVGVGFIGAVLVRLAASAGARVLALGRRPWALDLATRLGAAETVRLDEHAGVLSRVRDLTAGKMCDRVIEAVGEQWPLDLAGELTRERGRLIIAGYHQDGPRQVNLQLWNWRGLDVINAHEREIAVYREGTRLAAEAAADGRLEPDAFVTHHLPLARLAEAFDLLQSRPDGFLKAVVVS